MYSLEQLQQKNLKELKEIGWQLNVLPSGDRRCRQNWIDVIVGINPPLLELLEVSPAVSVEQVQEPIEVQAHEPPIVKVVNILKLKTPEELSCIAWELFNQSPEWLKKAWWSRMDEFCEDVRFVEMMFRSFCRSGVCGCSFDNIFEKSQVLLAVDRNKSRKSYPLRENPFLPVSVDEYLKSFTSQSAIAQAAQTPPGVEVEQVQEPIVLATQTSPGVDRVQEAIELSAEISPGVEVDRAQEPIAPAAKKLPGSRSKASTAHQLLELFQSRTHVIEDSPGVKTEATVSESAIGLPAKNPILTGIALSDKFCACYSSPQAEIIHFQSDADGQLSLLNFEIESASEPPDPDDFESLDAFREALARWDFEHPEELAASLDSMCEWAPCPADWYEFDTPREPSEVSELSRELELSQVLELSTSNFFIPTFSAEGVSPNRTDEPPDTGFCARLPKPKPPSFSPTAAGQAQAKHIPNSTQTQPKLNLLCQFDHSSSLKFAYCGVIPVGRAPPGGDAM